MCNLSQGIKEKAEARGEANGARGIIKIDLRHGVSNDDILVDLQEALNIPLQKAQEYLKEFGMKTV